MSYNNRIKRFIYGLTAKSFNERFEDCIKETYKKWHKKLPFQTVNGSVGKAAHNPKFNIWAGISRNGPTKLIIFNGTTTFRTLPNDSKSFKMLPEPFRTFLKVLRTIPNVLRTIPNDPERFRMIRNVRRKTLPMADRRRTSPIVLIWTFRMSRIVFIIDNY